MASKFLGLKPTTWLIIVIFFTVAVVGVFVWGTIELFALDDELTARSL